MKKKVFLIGVIISFAILIVCGIKYQDRKVNREFDFFYSNSLLGRIVKSSKSSRSALIVLNNSKHEYEFYPYAIKKGKKKLIFQYTALPGDSVYKQAYSDTLLLIKSDETLYYTFKKH